MTHSNTPPGRFNPLDGALTPILGLVLSAIFACLTLFLPSHTASNLHLEAVRAAQDTEPSLSCTERQSPLFKPKLAENVRPEFRNVVGIVNRLGTLVRSGDRQNVAQCRPADLPTPPYQAESVEQEITRLTSDAINRIDKILASYHGNTDAPQSTLRNLQKLRSSVVRVAYAEGQVNGIRLAVWLTEAVTLLLSFVYMFVTFMSMRSALPEGREWFHWASLGITAVAVGASLYILATRDFVIAAYFLMVLMLISVAYARSLTPILRDRRYCGLLSFVRLLKWGALAYFIVLMAVAIPYFYGELSVGSYAFRLARLNVANAFWTISLSVFAFHLLLPTDSRSRGRSVVGYICLALGPSAFLLALGYYYWFRSTDAGYPGNILYGIIPDTVRIRAAVIEIAVPRLMISLPLIVVILRRLIVRIQDGPRISEFIADHNNPSASVPLELLPRFRVHLSRHGVLFPNVGACLPETGEGGPGASINESPTRATELRTTTSLRVLATSLLKSSRPVNVLMALTLASISYASTSNEFSVAAYTMLLLSVAFAVSGSFIVNDVADRAIDRINNPNRPVAAGTVTPRQALVAGVLLLSVAPLFAMRFSLSLAILCLIVCLASLFYSFYLKSRNGVIANVLSAALTVTLCFVGFDIANPSWTVVGIAIAVFFAALAREIAKDVEDLPGDRLFRKSTLAIVAGQSTATRTAVVVAGAQIIASYIPYVAGGATSVYLAGITIANLILLRALRSAYTMNAAHAVQRAVKLSMALYLVTYLTFLPPMDRL